MSTLSTVVSNQDPPMTINQSRSRRERRGATLMAVLLIALVAAAIVVVSAATTANASLIAKNGARSDVAYQAAESGIAQARNWINTNPNQQPFRAADSGEIAWETNAQVYDALGNPVTGMTRTTWVGKSGSRTGEFGVFGAIISQVTDAAGNVVVHRGTIYQDTFAKYAYFSNSENGIYFGGGDQVFGPAHSNDNISIAPSGAEFHDPVTTSKTIIFPGSGIFDEGYRQHQPIINLPSLTALTQLKGLSDAGNVTITGSSTAGTAYQATTRIEFVALDLNGDGDSSDADEGFMRVFQSTDPRYVVAGNFGQNDQGDIINAGETNCGALVAPTTFQLIHDTPVGNRTTLLSNGNGRCYLGGDDRLDTLGGQAGNFMAAGWPGGGHWLQWPGAYDPRLGAAGANRQDSLYLWPITYVENPNFQGIVFVDGKVAISGKLRGRLTVVSPYTIIIAGDMTLETNPAVATCPDYLGIYAGQNVWVADNAVLAPQSPSATPGDSVWRFGPAIPTQSTYLQASVMALGSFGAENYGGGVVDGLSCEAVSAGRGCLYLVGGIIQGTRQPVGTLWPSGDSGQTGYIKRYQFNQCGLTLPPPYFPTTGRFSGDRSYEMSPVNFDEHVWYVIPDLAAQDSLLKIPAPPAPAGAARAARFATPGAKAAATARSARSAGATDAAAGPTGPTGSAGSAWAAATAATTAAATARATAAAAATTGATGDAADAATAAAAASSTAGAEGVRQERTR